MEPERENRCSQKRMQTMNLFRSPPLIRNVRIYEFERKKFLMMQFAYNICLFL